MYSTPARALRSTLLALAVGLASGAAVAESSTPSTMTISATGTASASPDQVRIVFGVESAGVNARDAMADNTRAMTAVFESLDSFGIGRDAISTSGISMNPRYDHRGNGQPRIEGYQVANKVTVTVEDIDALGQVLDGIVGAGVNAINSVTFAVSDTSDMEAEARTEAALKARAKATAYAEALGTDIMGILSVSEATMGRPQPYRAEAMRAMAMDAGGPVPVSASDVDLSVTLNVVFELSGEID